MFRSICLGKRKYIDGSLNFSAMFKMYTEKCKEIGKKTSSPCHLLQSVYWRVQHRILQAKEEPLCSVWTYKNLAGEEKQIERLELEQHKMEVALVRKEKEWDKWRYNSLLWFTGSNTFTKWDCFNILLQLSKLYVYTFTVFDIKTKQGYYHFCHEAVAKRGADEISCVFRFMIDNCVGKNETLSGANCVAQNKRVLMSGPIYVPSEIVTVDKSCKRSGNSYLVKEIETDQVQDWKKLPNKYHGWKGDMEWCEWIRVTKDNQNSIYCVTRLATLTLNIR